jgi:N-acetylmuramoyl-L-alanine amidase
MRRNSFRIVLSAAGVLTTFLACSSYAARTSSSSGDSSPITVVIDAGHGGYDRGGIPGQRVSEKDMTLDVARRLRSVLQASGYRVVMTRDSDVFVPLGTRTAIANSNRNAIFVSVHFNSATRSGASGIETYFYSRNSLSLASAIHHYVSGGAPSSNRGVRRRGYFVLRRTNMPAVLVECFLSSKACRGDCIRSTEPQFRRQLPWYDPSCDSGKHPAATVHRPNQGHQIQKEPLEAFGQEKHSKEEKLLETVELRRTRGVVESGGLIESANFDFGTDASR